MTFLNLVIQFVKTLFTYTTANDFANLREEHVCALYCLSVFIDFHIERLDVFRVIGHDNRFAEMFFYQVTLMFRTEVIAPFAWEFKLTAILDSFLKNVDAFRIWQAYKLCIYNRFQSLN